eukprot:6112110-Pleurochrysis_carterae.AAC.2
MRKQRRFAAVRRSAAVRDLRSTRRLPICVRRGCGRLGARGGIGDRRYRRQPLVEQSIRRARIVSRTRTLTRVDTRVETGALPLARLMAEGHGRAVADSV